MVTEEIVPEDDGQCINLSLIEFMRNFEMIDSTHYKKHYNSYFYSFKTEANEAKMYSFEVHQKTNLYLTLIREYGERSKLRMILIHYTNEATY